MINSSGYKHWVGKSLGGGKVAQYQLSTNMYRRALSERNRIYVMAMCYPNPVFAIILPMHLMLLLFEGIVLAVIKRDVKVLISIYLSSIGSFWRKRNKIFSIRHKIQRKRAINCKMFLSAFNLVPHKLKMLIKHGSLKSPEKEIHRHAAPVSGILCVSSRCNFLGD